MVHFESFEDKKYKGSTGDRESISIIESSVRISERVRRDNGNDIMAQAIGI